MANLNYNYKEGFKTYELDNFHKELKNAICINDIEKLKLLMPKVTKNTEIHGENILYFVLKNGTFESLLIMFENNIKTCKIELHRWPWQWVGKTLVDVIVTHIHIGRFENMQNMKFYFNKVEYRLNDRYKMIQLAVYNNHIGSFYSIKELANFTSLRCKLKNLPIHFFKQMAAFILFTNNDLTNKKDSLQEFIKCYELEHSPENIIIEMTTFYIKNVNKLNLLYCFQRKNLMFFI